jgi:hypothetical protein
MASPVVARLVLRWTHVDPDDAAQLVGGIRLDADALFEVTVRRLAGHVDARASRVVLPAVIHAAQAALFVAAEEQWRAAVRAIRIEDADFAVGVPKSDQILAEGTCADRISVSGRQLV